MYGPKTKQLGETAALQQACMVNMRTSTWRGRNYHVANGKAVKIALGIAYLTGADEFPRVRPRPRNFSFRLDNENNNNNNGACYTGYPGNKVAQFTHLTSELSVSDFPISPTRFQLNFFSTAIRALLHATCDGIVRKNNGYVVFFDSVGVVEPNDNWKDEHVLTS